MNIKARVGNRIKEIRREQGLSQEALANKAEVDRTYVTDVENGRRNISIETLLKIIIALGMSVQDFFHSKDFS